MISFNVIIDLSFIVGLIASCSCLAPVFWRDESTSVFFFFFFFFFLLILLPSQCLSLFMPFTCVSVDLPKQNYQPFEIDALEAFFCADIRITFVEILSLPLLNQISILFLFILFRFHSLMVTLSFTVNPLTVAGWLVPLNELAKLACYLQITLKKCEMVYFLDVIYDVSHILKISTLSTTTMILFVKLHLTSTLNITW